MTLLAKTIDELRSLSFTFLYFAISFTGILVLKDLFLEEYDIEPQGIYIAFFIALVVAKVVLILDHVVLFKGLRNARIVVNVLFRTAMYTLVALLALVMEKAFETRHEYGGFNGALTHLFDRKDINQVWATLVCVAAALLGHNVLAVIREHFPRPGLSHLFFRTREG